MTTMHRHAVRVAKLGIAMCFASVACHQRAPVTAQATPALPRPVPTPTVPVSVAVAPQPTPMMLFKQSVDSMVADPQWNNAHWGILIVDPTRGDTMYAHNADKLFMPASNQKIVTGAVGLTQLGANYAWHTPVLLRGVQRDMTFTGDIIIQGRGDPSWSDALHSGNTLAALQPIADALNARGIKRVVGSILQEGEAFNDETTGFGWAFDDFDEGYSAAIDDLLLNEGFFKLRVEAGQKIGKVVTATTSPTKTYPKIVVQAVARERADSMRPNRTIQARWDSVASAVIVSGTLPLGDTTVINLAYRHPADAALAGVREMLVAQGIKVDAPGKSRPKPTPKMVEAMSVPTSTVSMRQTDTLVTLHSPPLRDVLRRLEKPSQNQLAEMLFKTISLERTGVGRADSARAVIQRQLVEWGVPPDAIAVRDGSGLSRHDYVAPRTLVRILDKMRQSRDFDAFYNALPIAGVDGTIASRMKGTVAENNVHAKTGTVDKARSLSGYVTTADGQLLIFSMLCNNYTVPTRNVERVQDAIAVQLASMRLRSMTTGSSSTK